jgi:hypothetical protein
MKDFLEEISVRGRKKSTIIAQPIRYDIHSISLPRSANRRLRMNSPTVDSRMIDILALILHGRGAVKIISSIYHADGNRRSARQQYLNFVAIPGKPRSRPDSL